MEETGSRDLTKREEEIYHLLLDGKSNKEIAAETGIGLRGVRFHVSNILKKFAVDSRVTLLVKAKRTEDGSPIPRKGSALDRGNQGS